MWLKKDLQKTPNVPALKLSLSNLKIYTEISFPSYTVDFIGRISIAGLQLAMEKKPHSTYRIKEWIIHTEIREGGKHFKNCPNATFKKYQEHVQNSMEP